MLWLGPEPRRRSHSRRPRPLLPGTAGMWGSVSTLLYPPNLLLGCCVIGAVKQMRGCGCARKTSGDAMGEQEEGKEQEEGGGAVVVPWRDR